MAGELIEAVKPEQFVKDEDRMLVAPPGWVRVDPPKPEMPSALKVTTLRALAGFVNDNRDKLPIESCTVTADEAGFSLLGPIDATARRATYLTGSAPSLRFKFGQFMKMEEFLIALQTQFVRDAKLTELLTFASTVTAQSLRTSADDGYSQEVGTKRGIHLVGSAKVPSPVVLAPWRTFREVEQPTSPFVLRLRDNDGPEFALFEADGDQWRVEAAGRVAAWLRKECPEVLSIIS